MIWLWLIPTAAAFVANLMPIGEYRGDRTASHPPLTPTTTQRKEP